jgi:putative oxidoreductase
MTPPFDTQLPRLHDIVLLFGRLLMALLFLHEAITLATSFPTAAAAMEKLGVPAPLLALTTALQLVAGLALVLGWHARLGAAGLGLFCIATALLFHANPSVRNEVLHFEKDLAIAGGMLVLVACGSGSYSVDAYLAGRGRTQPA